MKPKTVTFFGNFGTHNLGNECTLEAIVQNARRYLPAATLQCVCSDPEETTKAHGIAAFPMSYRYSRGRLARRWRGDANPLLRLVRRLLLRIPLEVVEWIKAYRTLRGTDMLVMTGTGMLGDFGIGPFDLHYEILKWSVVAKLRRCRLLFVSVGAGPLAHPLSRWLVKSALSLADYRSYRDVFSRQYLVDIGFNASKDRVYPDLAFSLGTPDSPVFPDRHRNGGGRIVGLGLMEYYGQHQGPVEGERIYRRYIERMARFAAWLLEQRYSVLLLIGDASYDRRVKQDLLSLLKENGAPSDPNRISAPTLSSPEQLYAQLAETDMVVATRFHNVLLGLMLNRPVIALSYHEKVRSLMAGVGAADYCQDAADLDVPRLIEQVKTLQETAEAFSARMRGTTSKYREALDEQYRHIFGAR